MEQKSYVVAIDIGSSEVVVAVGSVAPEGNINIESIVSEPTSGVSAGLVDNNQRVVEALRKAKERAEQEAGVSITDAYVSMSGKFVRCARYTDHVFVEDPKNCISERDVRALHERMFNVKAADGEDIMELYPLNYKSDKGVELSNPIGSYSKQLHSTYNFILCERNAKDRFRRVFLDAGITINGLFAGATVIAESLITSDEKEDGVAVVDIGSGVTDIAIYHNNTLCYISSIPIGGSAVNGDIRHFCSTIPPKTIEKLKKRYGSAQVSLTPDEMIQIRRGTRAIKPIARLNLAAVIEARMTDIAEYVWNEIRDAGFAKKLASGIVLTGGVAELKNVAELFSKVTGQDVRIACAEIGITADSYDKVSQANLSLAVSLLLRGARVGACPVGVLQRPLQPQPEVATPSVAQASAQGATINSTMGAATQGVAAGVAAGASMQEPARMGQPFAGTASEGAASEAAKRVVIPTLPPAEGGEDSEPGETPANSGVKSGEGAASRTAGIGEKFKNWFTSMFESPDEEDEEYDDSEDDDDRY